MRGSHSECYHNVSTQIMENFYEELFNKLERQLYNLDLIYRSMQISGTVLDRIKQHQFSPACTKPLTQLQNCGHCSGYSKFKPCLFYCINLLRGCFADIADIHYEFQLLTKALSDIPDDILPTFQPTTFIQESLHILIDLVRVLSQRNLKDEVSYDVSLLFSLHKTSIIIIARLLRPVLTVPEVADERDPPLQL